MCKKTLFFGLIIITVLCNLNFTSKNDSEKDLCKLIDQAPKIVKYTFDKKYLNNLNQKELKKIGKKNFEQLFDIDSSDYNFANIIGQFVISKNRKGLICLNHFPECDSQRKEISLFVVEDCKKILARYQLSYSDDMANYEVYSKIDKFKLGIKIDNTGDYSMETGSDKDTLFSEMYTINLASSKLDTIKKESKIKPFLWSKMKQKTTK